MKNTVLFVLASIVLFACTEQQRKLDYPVTKKGDVKTPILVLKWPTRIVGSKMTTRTKLPNG